MIRHQILSVRMSTRLVLRIGCFVFGCLFRAVTMQSESLRFASVRIWKRTQTTHPNTRKLSAICFCPYLEKNADYASSYEGTVCNFPLSLVEKEHRPHRRGRSARSNASLSLRQGSRAAPAAALALLTGFTNTIATTKRLQYARAGGSKL